MEQNNLDDLQIPLEMRGLSPEAIAQEFLTLAVGDMVFIRREPDLFCTARVSGFQVKGTNLIVEATQINPHTQEDLTDFRTSLVHPIVTLNGVPQDEWLHLQRFCLET